MAGEVGDMSDDCLEVVLDEEMQAHSASMQDQRANAASAFNILRHSSVGKFNREDPIEAAAVEVILGS